MVARRLTGWAWRKNTSVASKIGFYHFKLIVTTTCGTSVTFHAKERNKKTENHRLNPQRFFIHFRPFFFGGGGFKFQRRQKITKVVTIRLALSERDLLLYGRKRTPHMIVFLLKKTRWPKKKNFYTLIFFSLALCTCCNPMGKHDFDFYYMFAIISFPGFPSLSR